MAKLLILAWYLSFFFSFFLHTLRVGFPTTELQSPSSCPAPVSCRRARLLEPGLTSLVHTLFVQSERRWRKRCHLRFPASQEHPFSHFSCVVKLKKQALGKIHLAYWHRERRVRSSHLPLLNCSKDTAVIRCEERMHQGTLFFSLGQIHWQITCICCFCDYFPAKCLLYIHDYGIFGQFTV